MFARSLTVLLLAALSGVAFADDFEPLDDDGAAWNDDDLLDDEDAPPVDRRDRKKSDLPETTSMDRDFDEPEDEFSSPDPGLEDEPFGDEPGELLGDFEDLEGDSAMEDFTKPKKTARAPATAGPGPITLDVAGKEPLADNYPLSVVAVDRDAVVVELPVLIARSRVGLDKPFQLIAEVHVGDTKVGQVSQLVMPASLAEFGPSFAFLKISAPVVETRGEIRVVVRRSEADGSGVKDLFTRVTPYSLK